MLGHKDKTFTQHTVSLEDLVPPDNFYRHVEQCLDLSFIRELVRDCYASLGRPSIDPIVFFKLQLIAFFEGIRSERQLMELVNVNLAHRWYIGYDLDEPVPDHSSLSKIRARYGFQEVETGYSTWLGGCENPDHPWQAPETRAAHMADSAMRETLLYALDVNGWRQFIGLGFKSLTDGELLATMHRARAKSTHIPAEARLESQRWLANRTRHI